MSTCSDYDTYREIRQQPRVWREAYDLVRARKEEILAFTDKYLSQGYHVILTGAGTSAYIGDALELALHDSRFSGAQALATTDILTNPHLFFDVSSKVLLVSFARSGNSPESVGAVRCVEQTAGAVAHIIITCNAEGRLAQKRGDNVLCLLLPPDTNDLSLAMTSSYSTMFLCCSLIAHIDRIEQEAPLVEEIATCTTRVLDRYEKDLCALSRRDFNRAIFLGSGPLKGVAEECRLKLQELTDGSVMCAYDSFLGFRHGPKAVVNKDSLLVYLISPNPEVRRYELDLIRQIRSGNTVKGVLVVCTANPGLSPQEYDVCIETGMTPSMPPCYGCITYVVAGQLLGYFKSIDCGLCPDSPSVSGNISRVVEGVTLYE